ncbi:beta-1 3-galactosyltransferase 1-like [Sarcoptes scabiei]|nr:beta-1 3-galactosyltransferase 1-like [Sarcoptes scabiei]
MKTSFHDNSLLPGLASREYVDSVLAEKILQNLNNLIPSENNETFLLQSLRNEFINIGLEVYEQNFNLISPFRRYNKKIDYGRNLYAIFRAPRATGTETMLLSVANHLESGSTLPSIALMLSLAKFFASRNYWAKDIVFLIYDKESLGLEAWLRANQGFLENEYLKFERLPAKLDMIQAALNLNIESFSLPYVHSKIEGQNGQLPNLDFFNIAVELCNRESVPVLFHGHSFYITNNEFDNLLRQIQTISSMMKVQASMFSSGPHGIFQKFAIPSITIEGLKDDRRFQFHQSTSTLSLGRTIEGIVRSLNNMLEKFNRSFYFYLLLSTRRFISISSYMIAFGLLASPLVFKSLHYYFKASSMQDSDFDFWASFRPCFLAHSLSVSLIFVIRFMLLLAESNQIPLDIEESLPLLISFAFVMWILIPFVWIIITDNNESIEKYHMQSLITTMNCLLFLTSISLINFSLAYVLALIYVPLMTFIPVQDSFWSYSIFQRFKFGRKFCYVFESARLAILLCINPFVLHLIALKCESIQNLVTNDWNTFKLLLGVFKILKSYPTELLSLTEHWYIFDNWALPILILFAYPVWLQLWFQASHRFKH